MGGLSTHQGYYRDFFLLAESHNHFTISYTMAAVGGFGKIQPL